jgi:peptide/nickel transport system substrate-binding protein
MEQGTKPIFARVARTIVGAALVALVAFMPLQAEAQRRGGTAVIAQEAGPPTLDMHFATAIATRNVSMQIYEQLITRDERNAPMLELAESLEQSADGLTYSFRIRRGVKFHNGKPLTSADVLASFERFAKFGIQKSILTPVASMSAPDLDTFRIVLKTPVPVFLEEISQFANPIVIVPAEQRDVPGGRIDIIGTGPYQLVEWVADSHVRLRRFDGYSPDTRHKGTDGFGGHKTAWFDELDFRYVKEPVARVAGLETGQFHISEDVPTKAAKRLKDNRNLVLYPVPRWWIHGAWVNHSNPPFDRVEIRRAMQIGLDMDEIMDVATDGAFDLQPGFQYPGTPYYNDAGKEFYNVNDRKKAAELLKAAGYKGEEIVVMTVTAYQSIYDASVVLTEQLKQIGFRARLDPVDLPTQTARQRRADGGWHLSFTGLGTGPAVGPFGAIVLMVGDSVVNHRRDEVLTAIYAEMLAGTTLEARKASFAKAQARIFDQVSMLKIGDLTKVQAARSSVRGFVPFRIPRLWNVWIEG